MGHQEQECHHVHKVMEELESILPEGLRRNLDARDPGEFQAHER